MVELAAEADEALSSCREAFSSAREALFPVDSKLDADVQTKLKAVLAVEVKAATQQLAKLEDRLKRADSVVQKYRDEVKKSEREKLVAELKPALLEKVKNSSGEAIDSLELLVKDCEADIVPFYRGCKRPPSEFDSLASAAAASVELAQASVQSAAVDVCPIDENLEEEVRKELEKFIHGEIKASKLRLGRLERRLRRCSQIVKFFRADISKLQGEKADKVKGKLLSMLRDVKAKGSLSTEELFNKFGPADGLIDEAAFESFFAGAGADADMPREDRATVFRGYLKEGSSALDQEDIARMVTTFMKVMSATSLTAGLSVVNSKILRSLKSGQIVEVLEEAQVDEDTKLSRARVKTVVGCIEGWVTLMGNKGTQFLKECDAPERKAKA
jgi:hypothetical protein